MRVLVLSRDRRWLNSAASAMALHGDASAVGLDHLCRLAEQGQGADLLLVDYAVIAPEPGRLLGKISALVNKTPLIVTRAPHDPELITVLVEAGAAGYTREGSDEDELLRIMGFTLEGITLLDPEVTSWLAGRNRGMGPASSSPR